MGFKSPIWAGNPLFRRFESCRILKGICLWIRMSYGTPKRYAKSCENVFFRKATVRQRRQASYRRAIPIGLCRITDTADARARSKVHLSTLLSHRSSHPPPARYERLRKIKGGVQVELFQKHTDQNYDRMYRQSISALSAK